MILIWHYFRGDKAGVALISDYTRHKDVESIDKCNIFSYNFIKILQVLEIVHGEFSESSITDVILIFYIFELNETELY